MAGQIVEFAGIEGGYVRIKEGGLFSPEMVQSVELSPPTDTNKSLTKPHGRSRGRGRPKGSRNKQAPSGSLTPIVERRQGKNYPLVAGKRVPKDLAFDYPEQFFWLYQWTVWHEGKWKWMTKSKRVKYSRVHSVKYLIGQKWPVSEILHFIQTGAMPT
ncbi:hypothetical protein PN462_21180 [Spirulina sp. CS-785/01]|uniref:hypothetical protein n=1 Tax=Spirulina sp. CS-785/01 TaxID=3021716 RepID=UPI00232CF651|nr:hypothetical protein [Spirulina sp. CS-785/01]MDB9315640.1 hypothetical protein [Spirulina sp. CS-785/01]